MDNILKNYSLLNQSQVSRETCLDFELFMAMVIEKNKEINIISKETEEKTIIRNRHIIDSAQIIDFVDLKSNTTTDLGSGGGFPGIIMAIMLKNMKNKMNIVLYEKSHHKCNFLRDVSKKLNLDTEVIQKDIFGVTELKSGTIITRAFKPLPVIIELIYKNFKRYQNLVLFMGKSGKEVLEKTLKDWELNFEIKKSITNKDSFLLNIKNIEKKN
jgi:16S rRNA (guanine527-N7)-methyltransferase